MPSDRPSAAPQSSGPPGGAVTLDLGELVARGLVDDRTARVAPHPELDQTHTVTIPVRHPVAGAYVALVEAWVTAVRGRKDHTARPDDTDELVVRYCALAGLAVVPYTVQQLVDGLRAADPVPPYLVVARCTISHGGRDVQFGFRTIVDPDEADVRLRAVFPLPGAGPTPQVRLTLLPSRALRVDEGLGTRLIDLRRRWVGGDRGASVRADLDAVAGELERLGAAEVARALRAEGAAWERAAVPSAHPVSLSDEVAELRAALLEVERVLAQELVDSGDRPLDERRGIADDLWAVRTYLYGAMD